MILLRTRRRKAIAAAVLVVVLAGVAISFLAKPMIAGRVQTALQAAGLPAAVVEVGLLRPAWHEGWPALEAATTVYATTAPDSAWLKLKAAYRRGDSGQRVVLDEVWLSLPPTTGEKASFWQLLQQPLRIGAMPFNELEVKQLIVADVAYGNFTATLKEGGWHLGGSATLPPYTTVSLSGTIQSTGDYNMTVAGTLDPATLMPITAPQANFSVGFWGGKDKPIIQGGLTLPAGPLVVGGKEFALGLSSFTLNRLSQSGSKLSLEGFTELNGGALSLKGQFDAEAIAATANLAADKLLLGLPLEKVEVAATLSQSAVVVTKARAGLWQGALALKTPLRIGLPYSGALKALLTITDLSLAQALALAQVEGLSASGSLSGQLPLEVKGGALTITKGQLASTGPGKLVYAPANPPSFIMSGGGGEILGQVMSDFNYKQLSLQLDGTLGRDLTVATRLEGANPSFYSGHAVAFNLNLSGALESVLQQGLQSYRLSPEALQSLISPDKGEKP